MVNDLTNPFQSPLVTKHGHEVSFVVNDNTDKVSLPSIDNLVLTNKFTGVRTRLGDEYVNAFNQAVKTYAIATGARAQAEEAAAHMPEASAALKRYAAGFEPYNKVKHAMIDMSEKLEHEAIGKLNVTLRDIDNLAEGREQLRFAAPRVQDYAGDPQPGVSMGGRGNTLRSV